MPIFEYECDACGHCFDTLQKAGEGALRKCPSCGRLKLRKCVSAPGFQLRGSGWNKAAPRDPRPSGRKVRQFGHTLDSGPAHSHDDHHAHGGHGPKDSGHGHSHGHGHGHSHGPGHKHKH